MTAKELYLSTLSNGPNPDQLQSYLQSHLNSLPSSSQLGLPETYNHAELEAYLHSKHLSVIQRYDQYLQRRRNGGPRELFPNKAVAYYYIECVSPTKLVDGCWLYSTLKRRDLNVYAILHKIFIEELGEGHAHMNHVYIYKALLERYNLNQDLNRYSNDLYTQGALQLAMGYSPESILPEIVGYNLGYEQLPYDLLVITYELDELGIDPYYFSLHVTADNSSTGHAKNATDAVLQLLERCPDEQSKADMYQRIRMGYSLNDVGPSSFDIIKRFSFTEELCKCIAEKSKQTFGIHTKMVRIGSYNLNEWLDPERCKDLRHVESFLKALVDSGYIRKGMPAENSKFWQYISAETRGVMYGVFSEKEKQLIKLYIESDVNSTDKPQTTSTFQDNSAIEALIDKYLGKSLSLHKNVQLPDPDTGDYKPLADIYTNNRSKFLQSFKRYSIRRATADSFCWGRMKKVMPESDKQLLLQWLAVHDPKMMNASHTQHNNTIPAGVDSIVTSFNITSHQQLVKYLNTLLYVISKYLDPREHCTESGIIMTRMYDVISRHTPLGSIDKDVERVLQPLNYWALLGVCMHTLQSTFLSNTCDANTLLDDRIASEEDRQRLLKTIKHAAKKMQFNIPGENMNRKKSNTSSLLVSDKLRASGTNSMPKSCQRLLTLLLSIFTSFILLSVLEISA